MDEYTQTDISSLESYSSSLNFDIKKVKKKKNYKTLDEIVELSKDGDKENILINQVNVRDHLLTYVLSKFNKLRIQGKNNVEDLEYIKLKNCALEEQVKALTEEIKLLITQKHKRKDDKYCQYCHVLLTNTNKSEENTDIISNNIDNQITEQHNSIGEVDTHKNDDIENINITNHEYDSEMGDEEREKCRNNLLESLHKELQSNTSSDGNQLGLSREVDSNEYKYDETSGLYYHSSSGYYYDADNGLYYDGNTGTYFYYDYEINSYVFHSQVDLNNESAGGKQGSADAKETNDAEVKDPETKETFEEARDCDKEEGECSESDAEENTPHVDNEYIDIASHYYEFVDPLLQVEEPVPSPPINDSVAPSLRLMVTNSGGNDEIEEGSLHLVTITGGTIGREKNNYVYLPDLSISKVHAEISYLSNGDDDHHYYIKDLGSNNGTFVNGKRISENRDISDCVEIGHGFTLQLGQVILGCHVHPGYLTCVECEPGLISVKNNHLNSGQDNSNCQSKEKARKKVIKKIKRKYGIEREEKLSSSNYTDRAEKRRDEVGSDNPYEKTEVSHVDIPINKKNKGFNLMMKMGWSEGESLGKSNSGILEPIQPDTVHDKAGLGSNRPSYKETLKEKKKRKIQKITEVRFKKADIL